MRDFKHTAQPNRERRDLPLQLVKMQITKDDGAGKPFRFKGYGSVWNRIDSYGDTMLPGAFTQSLKDRTPMMFYGHDPRQVPGKYLTVREDDYGLLLEGELTPGHSLAADTEASLRHQSITGMSVGGYTRESEWIEENGEFVGRRIKAFELYEVSIVSMPAEGAARIDAASLKSALQECETLRAIEKHLREERGFSRGEAEALVGRVKALVQGDPGDQGTAKEVERLATSIKGFRIPTSLLET